MWSTTVVQIITGLQCLCGAVGCQFMSRGSLCLFEPVQVVCLEGGEAHVVAAGATIAGRAGGAGHTYFVGGLSNPVAPGRQRFRVQLEFTVQFPVI